MLKTHQSLRSFSESAFCLDIFCGSGAVSKVCFSYGYNTFSLDIRSRKNVCKPDLRLDIRNLSTDMIPSSDIYFGWFGLPCDIWSYASGSAHWHSDGSPKSQKCLDHIDILRATMSLIDKYPSMIFVIENPRGKLRKYAPFINWLYSKGGLGYTVFLSDYGFPSSKPTNLFTNRPLLFPPHCTAYGRGAKSKGSFSNMTKSQRQSTPMALIDHVFSQIIQK